MILFQKFIFFLVLGVPGGHRPEAKRARSRAVCRARDGAASEEPKVHFLRPKKAANEKKVVAIGTNTKKK
jgi:hypothetical protein